jgi:hypothetical protein
MPSLSARLCPPTIAPTAKSDHLGADRVAVVALVADGPRPAKRDAR